MPRPVDEYATALASDGAAVVMGTDQGSIWIAALDGSGSREIRPVDGCTVVSVAIDVGRDRVAALSANGELSVFRASDRVRIGTTGASTASCRADARGALTQVGDVIIVGFGANLRALEPRAAGFASVAPFAGGHNVDIVDVAFDERTGRLFSLDVSGRILSWPLSVSDTHI
jgi:hypothetical protein